MTAARKTRALRKHPAIAAMEKRAFHRKQTVRVTGSAHAWAEEV